MARPDFRSVGEMLLFLAAEDVLKQAKCTCTENAYPICPTSCPTCRLRYAVEHVEKRPREQDNVGKS